MEEALGSGRGDSGRELLDRLPQFGSVAEYLYHYAAASPDADAAVVALGSPRLSYARLALEVDSAAAGLIACGVGKGDRVAMLSTPRPEYWITFLATTRIGAVWMGLNPRYSLPELRRALEDATPKVLFAFRQLEGRNYDADLTDLRTSSLVDRLVICDADDDGSWPAFLASGNSCRDQLAGCPFPEPQDPALLVYTSGTTGRPKGALLTHHGLVFCSRVQASHIGHVGQRVINNLPINHVGCVGDISVWTLILGGCLVFMEKFDPGAIIRVLGEEGITCWGQVPTMFQLTVEHPDWPDADLSTLRYVTWSGAMAPRPLIEQFRSWGVKVGSAYGMTETVGSVTYADDDDTIDILAETIGRPDPHYDVRVAAPDGHPISVGEAGEVQVRGSFVMAGYLNLPEATAAAFTADGWLKTGDAAVENADGTIRLVGRLVEMFKSGGYNVYPREIEQVLDEHPGVLQSVVVPRSDPLYGEVGHAFIVLRAGEACGEEDLRRHCRARMANYKLPKSITIVADLPMLPIGKIDRGALKRLSEASTRPPAAG